MSNVRLISITKPVVEPLVTASDLIGYVARVSNPSNQENMETYPKLIKYLTEHNHWSPLEMADATVEIKTTRDIARQMLRHRSFTFQEFSQRYAEVVELVEPKRARRQDTKNRQNSIDDVDEGVQAVWKTGQWDILELVRDYYQWAIGKGIAKECARVILPEGLTPTTLYMKGNFRSWLHYLELREDEATQLEHREIAQEIRKVLGEHESFFRSDEQSE